MSSNSLWDDVLSEPSLRLERFLPPLYTKTPSASFLKSREAVVWTRSAEVVPSSLGELEELGRDDGGDLWTRAEFREGKGRNELKDGGGKG